MKTNSPFAFSQLTCVLELALEIVNVLWDREKSLRLRDALCELVGELK